MAKEFKVAIEVTEKRYVYVVAENEADALKIVTRENDKEPLIRDSDEYGDGMSYTFDTTFSVERKIKVLDEVLDSEYNDDEDEE